MDADKLIQMANRIGEFFEAWPERAEALEGVATHLRKFWDPRMRRELLARVEAGEAESLTSLVREAVTTYRESLRPPG